MPKKLIVTKNTRVAEICDLIPGDTITHDGQTGVIEDVGGTIKDGLLRYQFKIRNGSKPFSYINFTFKLTKA